jgi:hypothetical protein
MGVMIILNPMDIENERFAMDHVKFLVLNFGAKR